MKINNKEVQPGDFWISTSRGMSGWFAVLIWLNPGGDDFGPFAEPYDTGIGRYATKEEAVKEGKDWADMMNFEFVE
ncbi:MAG: hypothetical protein ACHQWH_03095 [Nitrososphaerales archaeon]